MTQAQKVQRLPFMMGTSLREIGGPRIVAPAGGGTAQGILPRNGLGARIRLAVTVLLAAGASVTGVKDAVRGALALLPNIQVTNNAGITLVNASAFTLAQRSELRNSVIGVHDLPGVSDNGQKVRFYVDLPLSPNLSKNALWGLIGLQSNTAEWAIKCQFADPSTVFTFGSAGDAATAQISVESWLHYFDIPDPMQFAPAPLSYAYIITDQLISGSQLNTGVTDFELSPLGGSLSRLLLTMIDGNGAVVRGQYPGDTAANGTPFWTLAGMKLDNVDYLTQFSPWAHDWSYAERYQHPANSNLRPSVLYQDALAVLETPNQFQSPEFKYGFIDPDRYASVKPFVQLDLNGGTVKQAVLVREYFQPVRYQ